MSNHALLVSLTAALVLSCTRTSPPAPGPSDGTKGESGAAILASCRREAVDAQTVVHDCGDAFVVMEARLGGDGLDAGPGKGAVEENLERFVTELVAADGASVARVLSRDGADFDGHRAVRVRLELAGKGRFVAAMVVVLGAPARLLSCSAKAAAEPRCDAVLRHLVRTATPLP